MHTLFHNVPGAASSVVETRPAFGAFGVGAEATCDGSELGDVLRRLKELAGALPTADAGHLVSPGAGAGTNNNYVGGFHEQYKAYLLHYAAVLRGLGAAQPAGYGATQGKGVPEVLTRPAGPGAPGELLAAALQHQLQLLLRPRPYTPQPPAGPLQPLLALLRQLQPQPQPQTPDATEPCDAWRRWYQLFEACGPRPDPTAAAAAAVDMPRTAFPSQCDVDMPCGPNEPPGSRARLASPLQPPSPGPQQRFQCDCCHKSYSTFSGLTKHKQFHCVSQVKKQFNCKYCDKSYVSLGALKMHIRTHTLPCKCQICGKAFSRPWLLNGHIRTHTGEKPFKCDFCGRAFADRSNLRAHLQTHSDVKKYSCKLCNKTFSRMSLLVKHTETVCGAQQDTKTCSAESISPSSVCSDQQDTASFSAV